MAKETITLEVGGMTCQNCVAHVTKALRGVPGVKKVEVTLPATATVVGKTLDEAALRAAIREAGYQA